MPYIDIRTSAAISEEQENKLKTSLGKAIEIFPGKTEEWLMLRFEDKQRMWFNGDKVKDSAMINVKIFGTAKQDAFDKMTWTICNIVSEVLGIPATRIYVRYEECDKWGWNNVNF